MSVEGIVGKTSFQKLTTIDKNLNDFWDTVNILLYLYTMSLL